MSLRIVFMGTPDFAVPSLKRIIDSKHEVTAVVTAIDKERGRGRKISYTPVKELAMNANIPILQPTTLKDKSFIKALKELGADLFVVVAFRILPKEVFTIPKLGSFNLHGSLLPKYRGAAPIHWAIIKGEKETGVTTFKLEEKVDTGNIILKEAVPIEEEDTLGSIYNKLSELGADIVIRTIDLMESGDLVLTPQDNLLATPAPKITKDTGKIEWDKPAGEIHNLIRGLNPIPGAYFIYKDKVIKIYRSKVVKGLNLMAGEIKTSKEDLVIGCGDDSLSIIELQQEGKKVLTAAEFLRGFNFN